MNNVENNTERGKTGEIQTKLLSPDGYVEDGRLPLKELDKAYDKLVNEFGWEKVPIYTQILETPEGNKEFTVYAYVTPRNPIRDEGHGVLIMSGIHGEEPAGPNAIAQMIEHLAKVGEKNRVVIIPICNRTGYYRNWRYPDWPVISEKGHSVGDQEWMLLATDMLGPRKPEAEGYYYLPEAKALGLAIVRFCQEYSLDLSLDLHEDKCISIKERGKGTYIYSQGRMGIKDPIALKVVRILEQSRMKIIKRGKTFFKEDIIDGMVDSPNDGSADEAAAAEKVYIDGQVVTKPSVFSAIVVETLVLEHELSIRIAAHAEVLQNIERFLKIANSFNSGGM